MTDNNTFLAVSPADLIRNIATKTIDHVCKIPCLSLSSFSCSLCELHLNLRVGRKWKGRARDNCKRSLNIEYEQDWSVGLGVTLGDRNKNIFF